MRKIRVHLWWIVLQCLFFTNNMMAQTVTWTGSTSSNYFTSSNWSPATNTAALAQTETLMIGNGSPNNCVLTGGNAANSYRPAKLNTLTGSSMTINGIIYPWGSDSLNGNITMNAPADFSVRNIGYIGRNTSATITINASAKFSTKNACNIAYGNSGASATLNLYGSFTAGTDLNIANGTGLSANINILGGSLTATANLTIGSNVHIYLSGIGLLKAAGDKRSLLNGLITNGQMTCAAGKTITVTYDGTNTIAQIAQVTGSMIREYPDSVVLSTTNLVFTVEKYTGNVLSYRYKGAETVNNTGSNHKYIYHDFTTSKGFEMISGCTYEVVQDDANLAHIVLKRPYTPSIGHITPCDAELHYILKKDDKAVYVYSKLVHKPNYPAFDLGSWRQVWWIAYNASGVNLCERIYTDSLRSWQMPSQYDYSQAVSSGGPQEIVLLTTGVRAGKYDGKYEYSMKFWDNPLWGHASNVNNIGCWLLNTSCEYYNEGPAYHDLNAAAGIIHQCMNGVHYGATGLTADTLTSWNKVYGPYLLLITDQSTGDQNWAAAKERLTQEKSQWPYAWVKDSAAYPPASLRGSVQGKFVISDALKPGYTGSGAWVGLTSLADGATNFQYECKDYQYWVKSDSNGNFSIPNIRPGTYSFFAYVDGAVGEYRQDNVVVTAGGTTSLGTLTRVIDRSYGSLLWEIGTPNRMSNEFKMGDFSYCEGNVQNKFRDSFPNPIEYTVANNNWATTLCYAHTKYPDTSAIANPGSAWKWRLNFTLPAGFDTTGYARLTIAYASSDHAQQWIYVNDENSLFTGYYPAGGDGNAFIRQSNYAKYTYNQILIPMTKLNAGSNVITLVMPSNSAWVSHLMYDYISLEANLTSARMATQMQPLLSPDKVGSLSIYPSPANNVITISNSDGKSLQNIRLFDVWGRMLFTAINVSEAKYVLNMAGFPAGVYVVRIDDGVHTTTRKFTKQ